MKPFRWPPGKNDLLKQERGVSFEDITVAVEAGELLEIVPHQNPKKYTIQKIMVVEVAGYAFLVPFVEEEDHFFLKTIIPSRKAARVKVVVASFMQPAAACFPLPPSSVRRRPSHVRG